MAADQRLSQKKVKKENNSIIDLIQTGSTLPL